MSAPVNADDAELAKFDAVAARFWDPAGEFRPLHLLNPVRTDFIAQRHELKDRRVLDVGCGGGLLAESLAARGAHVSGIDLAPGMIEVARLHARARALTIDYRIAGAEELAAQIPGGFDIVTCMEMLEHVPNPMATVAALAALVRPGGSLFVSTINRNARSFLLAIVGAEYVLGLIPRGTHQYERLIRPSELAHWARAAQLGVREFAGIRFNPLTARVSLSDDVAVNYLAHLQR
jgi:2-polyprenyl-6-hydroxyphenyl methylase/3-demethylubiquinone-9 3-methyltransferase